MTSTKRKIAATALAVVLAASTALGLFVSSASAVDMGGTYNNAKVISTSIRYAVRDAADARQDNGDPVVWLNIRKHGYKVNSSSGGGWAWWNPDVYYVRTAGSATCDIELTYPNAGYVSTTGEAVDLHVKAHLWVTYVSGYENETDSTEAIIDLNCKTLSCDGGNPGHAGMQFSMWVTKKGSSTRVNAYIPMLWGDIDQPSEPNVYGGVEAVGITSSATNVFTGTAVSSSEGHQSRFTPSGQGLGPGGTFDNNYYPCDGVPLTTRTWNGKVFYCGTHDCDTSSSDDYYKAKRDSCLGYIGHTSTSSTFDIEWTASTLGCTTNFGLIPNDPDFGYLTLAKKSSNTKTQQSPLCPEFYSLKDTKFKVVCVSSDYVNAGVTMGTFECKKDEGGTCEVTSGGTKGDSTTVMMLPPGTYNIIETAAPKLGYESQVNNVVKTVIIEDDKTTKLTGNNAITNKPLARVVVEKLSNEKDHWSYNLATYSRAGAQYQILNGSGAQVADSGPANNPTLTTRYELVVADGTSGSVIAGDGKYVMVNPAGNEREAVTGRVRSNVMMVKEGDYKLHETKASEGYTLDSDRAFTAEAGECTVVQSWEPPVEDPISIYKQDATYRALSASNANPLCRQYLSDSTSLLTRQRKQQIPQGDASLDGAQYRVTYYDGYYATEAAAASSGALQRTWTLKTATDATYGQGYSHMDVQHVSGGGLYYNAANAATQTEATVPLGTIVVTEVRASDGYTLKNADLNDVYTYVVQVRKINDTTTTANFVGQNYMSGTLDTNMNSRGELDSYNVVQRSDAWALKGDWGWRVMQEGYDLGHEWDMIYDNRVAATNPNPTSTVAGATFEFYNRSTYPVISPTDGKTIVPSGGKSASFDRDRYTYHEDEDMVRVCIHEWRELNAASDVAQRVCGIITDDLGYMSTNNGDGYHYHGSSNTWNVPATWTAALAYGSYEVRETVAPLEGYHLNQDYRGDVVARQDRAGRTESGVVSLNTDALKRNYGRYYVSETAKGTPVNEYLDWYTGDAVQWQFDYDASVDAWVRVRKLGR